MLNNLQITPELIVLVDNQDRLIGYEEKITAHRGNGKRHRAISVFLFNDCGELLVQQRSNKKIVGSLQWANTCCGNVNKGETRRHCAHRRLKQELGIDQVKLKKTDRLRYHIRCNSEFSEWEIDDIYTGMFNDKVFPNPDEVCNFSWIKPTDFLAQVKANKDDSIAPWVKEIINHTKIRTILQTKRVI